MALKVNKDYHTSFELEGSTYYMRHNPYGFGFEIMKKTLNSMGKYDYERYFGTTNKELLKDVFYDIVENEKLPDKLPLIDDEKIAKVLSFETKHYTHYYKVDNLEELKKVARHILKMRFNEDQYYNPFNNQPTTNEIGFNSKEEIEKLPNGLVKTVALKEWNIYENLLKEQKRNKQHWNILLFVLEGKGNIADVMYVLDYYENGNYSLIDLEIIE